jgi:ABC-2 type transport system permease protein
MRKVLVIAVRDYLATVRTKGFIIGLLLMPILMGGSYMAQQLVGEQVDVRERHYAIVDRSPGGELAEMLKANVELYNKESVDPALGAVRAPFAPIEVVPPQADDREQQYELSERVRLKELDGFLDIGPDVYRMPPQKKTEGGSDRGDSRGRSPVRYQSNRLLDDAFPRWAEKLIAERVYEKRIRNAGISVPVEEMKRVLAPVKIDDKELTRKTADGNYVEGLDENKVLLVMLPFGMVMLMFMVVMVGATPLMQAIVEEKMQRIAEVLLGSIGPFQLMLGKLIGTVAVSLTLVTVYLAGAYYALNRFGLADRISLEVVAWFILYQTLAVIMYGSLYIAVGAACTDMKETQSLMWPIMVLAMFPIFVAYGVIKEPNSNFAFWASLVPPATPMLMIARQSVPPGIPVWEPVLGVVLVLLTTLAFVYASGRIFRVGILMQGKGARVSDLVRWVVRG